MVRTREIVRSLMILLCLMPFTSVRQASGALAPLFPAAPVAPVNEVPVPAGEEDDERETANGKERLVSHSRHRAAARPRIVLPPLAHHKPFAPSANRPTSPVDPDPFHNGLGSPYRC
jgi:hypothetical protein